MTHFAQFINFELVLNRVVGLSIALCCASIAASASEIRLPKIQNFARCLAEKALKTWASSHSTNGGQLGWSSWELYLSRPRHGKVFTLVGNAGVVCIC